MLISGKSLRQCRFWLLLSRQGAPFFLGTATQVEFHSASTFLKDRDDG